MAHLSQFSLAKKGSGVAQLWTHTLFLSVVSDAPITLQRIGLAS